MNPPEGVNPEVWRAGLDRARQALDLAPKHRECSRPRCKQPATDISGLCKRHIAKAARR